MATAIATDTLYGLADLRVIIDQALEESEGEVTPEIQAALDQWELDFPKKAEAVALYMKHWSDLADVAKQEAKRLESIAASRQRRADSLKRYLEEQMLRSGVERVESPFFRQFAITNNPPAVVEVVPTDETDFREIAMTSPELVTRVPESFRWAKDAIKAAAKAKTLPESIARRVQITVTRSLRIR